MKCCICFNSDDTDAIQELQDKYDVEIQYSNQLRNKIKQCVRNEAVLRTELNKLRQMYECKVCMDKMISAYFVPCGHLVSCENCCKLQSTCMICQCRIEGIGMVYIS